jgi:hypothetical protein
MSRKEEILHVACNPAVFGGASTFQITIPKQRIYIRPKSKPIMAMTLGSEVDQLITDWYTERGLPVPPEELIGAQLDAAEGIEAVRQEEAVVAAEAEVPSVAPEYGTPEFWAYHRAKKAAENKRRAEAGLPPLPTKKELEAEKAKKAAERAAKKGEKEALAAAKAAAKLAKKQLKGSQEKQTA